MKSILSSVFVLIVIQMAFAQADSSRVETKLESFQGRSNTLYQKEWIEIGKVRNELTVNILTVTDLTKGDKISGLVISWYQTYSSRNAFFDTEEVDDFLKAIQRMTTLTLSPPPKNYMEMEFATKSFSITVFTNKVNRSVWRGSLNLRSAPISSIVSINADDVSKLQALLTVAASKLKQM